jgi:hypothetical protein
MDDGSPTQPATKCVFCRMQTTFRYLKLPLCEICLERAGSPSHASPATAKRPASGPGQAPESKSGSKWICIVRGELPRWRLLGSEHQLRVDLGQVVVSRR